MIMASSSTKSGDISLPLEEIVFSCGICQATVSELYASKDSNKGFHSGSGDDDGVVTKLWIAECSHITCGKHLDGGAAPFHPKGIRPRASCPQCLERGDDTLRELFGIRGLTEGDYDPAIPASWWVCPPIPLDGSVPGMEPMRFQYMNIAHYAGRVGRRCNDALHKQHATEAAFNRESKQRRQVQAEVDEQIERIGELEKLEVKLKKWESRKPMINHYLGVVGDMTKEIEILRGRLSQLGYENPQRSYAYIPEDAVKPKNVAVEHQDLRKHHGQSSPTAVANENDNSSSSRKRKLAVYAADVQREGYSRRIRGSSRDMMPPPLPVQKPPERVAQHSRYTFSSQHIRRPPSSRQSVQVYEDRSWASQPVTDRIVPQVLNNRQALPFRPSPARGVHRRDEEPMAHSYSREDQRASVDNSHNGFHATQPLARLSIRSPPILQAPLYQNEEFRITAPRMREYTHPQSEQNVFSRDAEYGAVTQSQARQPLEQVTPSFLNRQPPLSSRARRVPATPLPHVQSRAHGASMISPFFGRGTTSQTTTTQQAPVGSGSSRAHHPLTSRETPTEYSMEPPRQDTAHGFRQQPRSNNSTFSQRPISHQPQQQSYGRSNFTSNGYTRGSTIPQTPRNQQGLLQRPEHAMPLSSHAQSRPPSNAQRGRISFLPSQQPASAAGNQEQALLQIRGVRGLGSQATRSSLYEKGPLYDPARSLYSSAGGRRSVRR